MNANQLIDRDVLSSAAIRAQSAGMRDSDDSVQTVPELSIVCVNWNSRDYLLECIASIYEHTHEISIEIIVVDNASPEGGVVQMWDSPELITWDSVAQLVAIFFC
jgi:hypothetical protein